MALVFKWSQSNVGVRYLKAKEVEEKKCLVRKNLLVNQNVRKCVIVGDTPATENVVPEIVLLASNFAISSFPAKIINVPQDVIHQDVTHAIKLRRYLAIVDRPEFLFHVAWNVLQNHRNVEINVRLLQIATIPHESYILVTLVLAQHVVRRVTKY